MTQRDVVDDLVDQWRAARPDLALDAMATIGRLGRLNGVLRIAIEAELGRHGLSVGEFDVLAALRRAGAPHAARPVDVARSLMLTPAGLTSRMDRLEEARLVVRVPDPDDRRSMLVQLTPEGLESIDRAVTDHVANEERLLSGLSAGERASLDRLLRRLLAALGGPEADAPARRAGRDRETDVRSRAGRRAV